MREGGREGGRQAGRQAGQRGQGGQGKEKYPGRGYYQSVLNAVSGSAIPGKSHNVLACTPDGVFLLKIPLNPRGFKISLNPRGSLGTHPTEGEWVRGCLRNVTPHTAA